MSFLKCNKYDLLFNLYLFWMTFIERWTLDVQAVGRCLDELLPQWSEKAYSLKHVLLSGGFLGSVDRNGP